MNRLKGYLTEDPKGIDRLALIITSSIIVLSVILAIVPEPKKPGDTCINDAERSICFRTGGGLQ